MLHLGAFGAHQRLWFELERWNSELHRICDQVRAAEALARRRLAAGADLSSLEGRLSLAPAGQATASLSSPNAQALLEVDEEMVTRRAPVPGGDIVPAREELRRLLAWLKSRLSDELTEREVYHCLFPLVIHADELLNDATAGGSNRWEALQGELYDVDNGGELFFTTVETLLHKEDTHPLVFEIYYFCLLDGFTGQYHNQPGKIAEYRRRIAERIPVEGVVADPAAGPARPVSLTRFPLRTYALSMGACVVVLAVLSYWARRDVRQSAELLSPRALVAAPDTAGGRDVR